jgi:hypothetical protein
MPRGLDLTTGQDVDLLQCELCKEYYIPGTHKCPKGIIEESFEQQMLAELKHQSGTLDRLVFLIELMLKNQ